MKKVHEQLKALSNNPPSKKKRKSIVPELELDDPLFLPSSLAVEPVKKSKPKKKSKTEPSSVAKKPSKLRAAPPAPPAPAPPATTTKKK